MYPGGILNPTVLIPSRVQDEPIPKVKMPIGIGPFHPSIPLKKQLKKQLLRISNINDLHGVRNIHAVIPAKAGIQCP